MMMPVWIKKEEEEEEYGKTKMFPHSSEPDRQNITDSEPDSQTEDLFKNKVNLPA